MDLKLDFNPSDVARALQESLVTSTFNEMVSKVVKSETDRIFKNSWSSDSIITGAVRHCIEKHTHEVINEQLAPIIKQKLLEKLSEPTIMDEMVRHTINSIHFR